MTAVRLIASPSGVVLFNLLDRLDDVVKIRPIAGVEFGMEQFAIGANFESAAARGNQRERFDALAELKNFGRQTDGLRRVVSNYAVFDRHLGFHHELLSENETIGAIKCGQEMQRQPCQLLVLEMQQPTDTRQMALKRRTRSRHNNCAGRLGRYLRRELRPNNPD